MVYIRSWMIVASIFMIVFRTVIPLQFSPRVRSPFFGNLIMSPLYQLSGTTSVLQTSSNLGVRYSANSSGSTWNSSAGTPSSPTDFPALSRTIASRMLCCYVPFPDTFSCPYSSGLCFSCFVGYYARYSLFYEYIIAVLLPTTFLEII